MSDPRILVFAGSRRRASLNRRLARASVPLLEEAGAIVTQADLADYPMPIYDGDAERAEGLPEGARRLKRLMAGHDGFLIASPEYNGSFPPLLKNVLDWCSRREPDDPVPKVAYAGKTAALVAASAGRFGGLRGLIHLRPLLANLGLLVVPEQLALGAADKALPDEGEPALDPAQARSLAAVARALVRTTRALKR
ncbi:MAG: NAD(P)H-dependent oxidoreductase [Geminicoccaceae bacterium]|nr:NAD(P)H-dependent oxidoreductase [Geminicoccaceae bacterium]